MDTPNNIITLTRDSFYYKRFREIWKYLYAFPWKTEYEAMKATGTWNDTLNMYYESYLCLYAGEVDESMEEFKLENRHMCEYCPLIWPTKFELDIYKVIFPYEIKRPCDYLYGVWEESEPNCNEVVQMSQLEIKIRKYLAQQMLELPIKSHVRLNFN